MNKFNLDLRKYYKDIKRKLPCFIYLKITFMSEFKKNVADYIVEKKILSINEIINHFGTPDEIATSFHTMDNNHLKVKARLYMILSIFLLLLLLFTTYVLIEVIQSAGGYNVEIID